MSAYDGQCMAEHPYPGTSIIYYCVKQHGHKGDHEAVITWRGRDD